MARFDSWGSYFYPETIDPGTGNGTLRNLYGERDAGVLAQLEYADTSSRAVDLIRGNVSISKTFDADHVRAIHAYLFQDVYEWAGEYRCVNMTKGRSSFADCYSGQIDWYLRHVHSGVASTPWKNIDRESFCERLASVFADLNQAHPFREGNGRTAKVFLEHVAQQSNYSLDFALVSPHDWNYASMLSGPDLGSLQPVPDYLIPVFNAITIKRTDIDPVQDRGQEVQSLLKMNGGTLGRTSRSRVASNRRVHARRASRPQHGRGM